MAKATSPSPPHNSPKHGYHVDIRGPKGEKIHLPVKNKAAAFVIEIGRASCRERVSRLV